MEDIVTLRYKGKVVLCQPAAARMLGLRDGDVIASEYQLWKVIDTNTALVEASEAGLDRILLTRN